MDLNALQKKLMDAGRTVRPSEQVPYAFPKRIMALIADRPVGDNLALWARALWRAVTPCAVITMVLCAWTLFSSAGSNTSGALHLEFEDTVLAAIPLDSDTSW